MQSTTKRLPATALILSLVSFFNDVASEMVTPLVPLLLAGVLGAGPIALGLIEGSAEAMSALLKFWSGRWSDLLGGRRKAFIVAGYGLSNLVRPLFGLVALWPQLLLLRLIDRVGKGLRTAPRDALLADATDASLRGRAFGLLRAMDNAGAAAGALLAAAILATQAVPLVQVIFLSALPGLLVVLLALFGIRDVAHAVPAGTPLPRLIWRDLPAALQRTFALVGAFNLARASETFVVFRGHELGMSNASLLLIWAAMSLAKSVASMFGGHLSDRFGHRRATAAGWLLLACGLVLLAWPGEAAAFSLAAVAYGALSGLCEGAERALIGQYAAAGARGTVYGWYNAVLGATAIPAGLAFGYLWHAGGAVLAFSAAGALGMAVAIALAAQGGKVE
ncbi:MAG: MFS transporter [Rhodocyclaceae bacterium]|nr:MFS transporter [Rhodocyclaceae bacterium]MBX3668389.1 MFS transporter [Rhodocyclaceae bacterium]